MTIGQYVQYSKCPIHITQNQKCLLNIGQFTTPWAISPYILSNDYKVKNILLHITVELC